MEPTPYAECSSEAPGLEATGKNDSPFQPGLRVLACSAGQVQCLKTLIAAAQISALDAVQDVTVY